MTLTELLTKHNACAEAVAWAATQPDLATAWRKCEHIEWMCWLASLVIDERTMRHLACDFAEIAWESAGEGETLLQCMLAVEIARGFADGTEDEETLSAAYYSADSAARYAASSAASSAAYYAARYAADSAASSAADSAARAAAYYAARYAARAAADSAADSAARAAAYSAASSAANGRNISIMRLRIPAEMICKATGVK